MWIKNCPLNRGDRYMEVMTYSILCRMKMGTQYFSMNVPPSWNLVYAHVLITLNQNFIEMQTVWELELFPSIFFSLLLLLSCDRNFQREKKAKLVPWTEFEVFSQSKSFTLTYLWNLFWIVKPWKFPVRLFV